ncbi:hypothetical protein Agub_g15091, partial [Astrephomene gubernaculifera]
SDAIVAALMTATGGNAAAVRRVYEALLSRGRGGGALLVGGSAMEAQLSSVRVKTQLLRSATAVCYAALSEAQSATPGGFFSPPPSASGPASAAAAGGVGRAREAGALADGADRLALEARRLGGAECEELASRLDAIRAQAESLLR